MSLVAKPIENLSLTKDPSVAKIGYDNKLSGATTSGSEVCLLPNTYERYVYGVGFQRLRFQTASPTERIDYIAIAAHNFGSHDGGLVVEFLYAETVGGSRTTIAKKTVSSNDPIMITFDELVVAEVVIEVTTTTAGAELGVISSGLMLAMPRPIYGGHNPIRLNSETEYRNSISETGQFLGRLIKRKGSMASFNWKNIDSYWVREVFESFIGAAKTSPFFIKWRPDMFDEVAYCQTESDIELSNQGGGNDLMSISMEVKAFNDL